MILRASDSHTNLAHLSHQRHWKADRGEHGQGSNCFGRERRRPGHRGSPGHDRPRPRPRPRAPRPEARRRVGRRRPRRPGRARQHPFQVVHQPGPAAARAGLPRRGAVDRPGAEGDRRRRPDRPAQRRQVHPALADLASPSRDRRLPVHHQVSQPGDGRRRSGKRLRGRRHPRADRGGPRGARPGPRVPPPRRADRPAGPPGRGRADRRLGPGRRTTGRFAASSSSTAPPWPSGPSWSS